MLAIAAALAAPFSAVAVARVAASVDGVQAVHMSVWRAARMPPKNTFDEAKNTVKNGAKPPQVGASPRSPARAEGIPSTSTWMLVPSVIAPIVGSGTGGAGGIRLGGCACACGIPRYIEPRCAAGNAG